LLLSTRITQNPFYHQAYNEILKNLSDPNGSSESAWVFGGKYRIDKGELVNMRYYVPRDANPPFVDELYVQVHVNGVPVDKCREYRDNLMVVFSTTAFVKGIAMIFPKAFMQEMKDGESKIDDKWNNAAIKNSKIIPPEGLPLRIKYRISDSKDIKNLANLKLTMESCGKDKR
jgi:hypothetical protein